MDKLSKISMPSILVIALALLYAVVRYNVLKGVAWEHFPLYIFNKGIALSSVMLIALSYSIGPLSRFQPRTFSSMLSLRKYFGLLGFGLASMHAFMSLLIFNQSYFPKFFEQSGQLNLTGELSMLFGVVALFIFSIVAISSLPSVEKSLEPKHWLTIQRLGYSAFALVMLHVFVMGSEGWLKPSGWPGGLLPISLVAFIIIALTLLLRIAIILFSKNKPS